MGAPVAPRETAAKTRDAMNSLDMTMQYATVSKIGVAIIGKDRPEELLARFRSRAGAWIKFGHRQQKRSLSALKPNNLPILRTSVDHAQHRIR